MSWHMDAAKGSIMLKKVILIGACIGASASVPILYQANPEAVREILSRDTGRTTELALAAAASAPAAATPTAGAPTAGAPSGRSVALEAGHGGHFIGTFKLNGRRVDALIDTGASAVAMNLSTARRLGLNLHVSDLKNTVTTANGKARATVATVDRIEIGRVSVENVQAVVLEDSSLQSTLIGMSFLGRLSAYKVENGRLVLIQ